MSRFHLHSRDAKPVSTETKLIYWKKKAEERQCEIDKLKKLLRMINSEDAIPELLQDMYDKIVGEG